jgi:hypothetical protein
MKKIALFFLFCLIGSPSLAQVTCSIPYTFVPNTPISSSQMNANFLNFATCFVQAFPLQGTQTNDNAAAGNVGEFVSISPTLPVTLATANVAYNVTSVSLSPGDWQCWGDLNIFRNGTTNFYAGWISTTSASLPSTSDIQNHGTNAPISPNSTFPVANNAWAPIGMVRESLAITTTVYLEASASGSSGSQTAQGFLGCRRMR